MPSSKNIEQVQELTQQINQAQAVYLIDYQGISANQFNQLRQEVRKQGGHIQVAKNSLFTIALRNSNQAINLPKNTITQSTAALYAIDDTVKPLKAVVTFSKENELPKLKVGFLQGNLLNEQKLQELSDLPSAQILMGQLVGMLNSPIQRLVGSLNGNLQKLVIALSEIQKQKANA